jgi:uncharacterized flavoprotein (TIGR03862 family)
MKSGYELRMGNQSQVAIIGAGPAALIAAEWLANAGHVVHVYDRMPSPARKLLIAGRGGLNLTHSEPLAQFLPRYGAAAEWLAPTIEAFPPDTLRRWCESLGEETFVGSSGRVFPKKMKAVGLLRAWLQRLQQLGVSYHPRHQWVGFDGDALRFSTPTGDVRVMVDATLLALGGASWPRLGSDGSWTTNLAVHGVAIAPLEPANCGFTTDWSDYFAARFAGEPLKPLTISHEGRSQQGEAMITAQGIEGGAIYALSGAIREAIARDGDAVLGAFQLCLQVAEVLVRLQLRVVLRNHQQPRQCRRQFALRRLELRESCGIVHQLGRGLQRTDARTRVGHPEQDVLLLFGETLDRGHQVGHEIGTPLVLVDHLRPGRLDRLVGNLERVVAAAPEEQGGEEREYGKQSVHR